MTRPRPSPGRRRRNVGALVCATLIGLLAEPAGAGWKEEDFAHRTLVALPFVDGEVPPEELMTVVGYPRRYRFRRGDTLWDVARHLDLGINEVTDALPDVDEWIPPVGKVRAFPTWWVLPAGELRGLVINIPEMRLYYFPDPSSVITYPVGLGRQDWKTPTASFRITEKTVDPRWVIPKGILEERIREKGRHETFIPGGHPENPLGRYRMRLSIPEYGIHGTNVAWGVGMQVSHGCIRLYPEDIERFFPLVPVGTPGRIVYEPVKLGARDGQIFLEVHRDVYGNGVDYRETTLALLEQAGWSGLVDWVAVNDAVSRKNGVPAAISAPRALFRHSDVLTSPEPGTSL